MQTGTRIVHSGLKADPYTGASSVPIYQASTFHQASVDEPPLFDYSRSGNPTRQAVEDALAVLENGTNGYAFASGMAAMSTALMLFSSGDHIIASEDLYGGTFRVLTTVMKRFGVDTTFVDATRPEEIRRAIRPNSKGLLLETPSNPTLRITDLTVSVSLAREHGLVTLVDNTFMSPYLQRPLDLGIDIVIHSATKFLGGHSDVLAGAVVVKEERLAKEIKFLQNAFGGVLGPQDSWLLLRGIKTLKVRMDAQQESAKKIAHWLSSRQGVTNVFYPGLQHHEGYRIQQLQADGPGAVLSFDVGSGARARELLRQVHLPLVAVSLGGVETILSYPATMSHASMPEKERHLRGITDGLLRLSVGLEDADDLIQDLDQALSALP